MDNERNEHFKGFAELLWNDLYQVAGALMVDTTPHEWDEIIAQLKILIAQRAYDLVYHDIEFLRYSPYIRPMQLTSTDTWVDIIPDLMEWPKTVSE